MHIILDIREREAEPQYATASGSPRRVSSELMDVRNHWRSCQFSEPTVGRVMREKRLIEYHASVNRGDGHGDEAHSRAHQRQHEVEAHIILQFNAHLRDESYACLRPEVHAMFAKDVGELECKDSLHDAACRKWKVDHVHLSFSKLLAGWLIQGKTKREKHSITTESMHKFLD
jgi:hypothetical protein